MPECPPQHQALPNVAGVMKEVSIPQGEAFNSGAALYPVLCVPGPWRSSSGEGRQYHSLQGQLAHTAAHVRKPAGWG